MERGYGEEGKSGEFRITAPNSSASVASMHSEDAFVSIFAVVQNGDYLCSYFSTMPNDNLVKILFNFYSDILDEQTNETMWAEVIDEEKGLYKISNIPFYVPLLASGDIVFAEYDEDQQMFTWRETIEHSGNSTIHIIIMDDELEMLTLIKMFEEMGCPSEGLNKKYLALEIPFNVDYLPIKRILDQMESDENIGYAETCLSDNHRYKDIEFGF